MEAQDLVEMSIKVEQELNINLTIMESMCIVANIELALRHPNNKGPAAFIAKKTAQRLIDEMLEVWPKFRERKDIMKAWGVVFDVN